MRSNEKVQDSFPADAARQDAAPVAVNDGITRSQFLGVLATGAVGLVGFEGYRQSEVSRWADEGYKLTPENMNSSIHLKRCLRDAASDSGTFACFETGTAMARSQSNAAAFREFAVIAQRKFADDPVSHAEIADRYLQQSAFTSQVDPLRERGFLSKVLHQQVPRDLQGVLEPALEKTADSLEPVIEQCTAVDMPEDIRAGLAYAIESLKTFAKNMSESRIGEKKYRDAESGIVRIASAVSHLRLPPAVVAKFTAELERIPFDPVFQDSVKPDLMALRGENSQ